MSLYADNICLGCVLGRCLLSHNGRTPPTPRGALLLCALTCSVLQLYKPNESVLKGYIFIFSFDSQCHVLMAIDSSASSLLTTLYNRQMEKPFIPRAENLLPKVKWKSVAQRKRIDNKYQESRQSSSRGARQSPSFSESPSLLFVQANIYFAQILTA